MFLASTSWIVLLMIDNQKIFDDLAKIWASYPTIWTPRVSGDGKWLVWAWAGITETANIWIVSTDGSSKPQMLTNGDDHYRVADISHDGSRVLLRQSIASDEHERLFLLNTSGGSSLEPLTPAQKDHYIFGACFHPQSDEILLNANCDTNGKAVSGSVFQVFGPATDARRVLTCTARINKDAPSIGLGGQSVLYHRNDENPRGRCVCVVEWDGSNDRCVFDPGHQRKASGKWFGSEGDILILTETDSHDRLGLLSSDGKLRWLIDDPDRNIEDAFLTGEPDKIMVIAYRNGRTHPFVLNVATGEETKFGSSDFSTDPLDRLEGGDWIVQINSALSSEKLVRTDATGQILSVLNSCDRPKQGRSYTSAQSVNWTSSDGEPVQGWLYQPEEASRGLIVWVHGGPTAMSRDRAHPVIQYLTSTGFTVLDPNFRGSTGFGMQFRNLIRETGWGGREQEDIRCAIEMLIDKWIAHPDKIGVAGHSFGGYSAWFAITRMSDLVQSACSICGMSDLFFDYENISMPHIRDYNAEMLGGTPDEVPSVYAQGSLRTEYTNIRGNLMIVHGLCDNNVSPENSWRANRDLAQLGIEHELLMFADEGHGIHKQSNLARLLANLGRFFSESFRDP